MGPLAVSPVLVDKAQIADIRLATRKRTLVELHRCVKAVVGLEGENSGDRVLLNPT